MSLLLMFFYWTIIPGLVLLAVLAGWRRAQTRWTKAGAVGAGAAALLGLLWLGVGRTLYYDMQVRELCAKDGGVKVYETVRLPADRFDQWGMVRPYDPTRGEDTLGPEYKYMSEDYFYRKGNPAMVRYHHQVIRRSDGKLLGETISYGRGGGDLPGPWEPSNYHCPPTSESSEIALFKNIFILSNQE